MNGKIINPESGRPVKILGKLGQKILQNLYIQNGGRSSSSKKKTNPKKIKSKITKKKSRVVSENKSIDNQIKLLFQ
tara:strand:- start:1559 stop:1786 length:228 start_codon:yes stop_codon:yes gene_type:complete